jgi:succinoglycan biosynthesis protein ExoM
VTTSVCIATFCRQDRLRALLEDLQHQQHQPDEIVVVDNDSAASARPVIEQLRAAGFPLTLVYDVQPQRNIAITRNATVHLARGDWLAFIDDDERAPPEWLRLLLEAAEKYRADGVLAPVEPQVPATAPAWIRRGKFYDWPHLPSGAPVPRDHLRFGNVLLRGTSVRSEPGPFDARFGLGTGEDDDLLARLISKGAKVIWCDEAIVWEPIERKRLSLRWLLQRALSGGQRFGKECLSGRNHTTNSARRALLFLQWLVQMLTALGLALLVWPSGRHRAAVWLIKASANLGKMSAFVGWRYSEYA